MNIKQNVIVAGLQSENRQLRAVIDKMTQEQAQGQFIEDLQCAALQGLCSQSWILADDMQAITGSEKHAGKSGVDVAIETSSYITNSVISQIMTAVKESQAQEEKPEAPPAENVHPKSSLIL